MLVTKLRYRILLSCCVLMICGCMQQSRENGSTAPGPEEKPAEVRSAPEKIDPAILENRTFGEAPMLAKKVAAGELPPVSERLPENPLVVRPIQEIGRYGGTLRRALTGDIIQETGITKTLNDNLMGFKRPIADGIELNLAESYEFQDEGRIVIFKIRKGVKWSDGVPFTVDDILFWYYDMTFDDSARDLPIVPFEWLVDGEPLKLEKIDDTTLKISSPKPMGRILHVLSHDDLATPKHIWAQYHPRYNPNADYLDFRERTTEAKRVLEPGIPRISAWVPTEWVRGQRVVYDRNPYYWKIDTAGNQLPYADRITFNIITEPQVILIRFINSELDLIGRYYIDGMVSTIRKEQARGKVTLHLDGPMPGPTFHMNWEAPNPALREAFRNRQVRIALSHAINREEISQIAFDGLLEPCGFSFIPGSPYFSEKTYKMYSEFDPAKSRALLDKAGYRDTDGDGWREFKNGERFEFNLDVTIESGLLDTCELAAEQWANIGIKTNLNLGKEEIIYPMKINGTFDVYVWNTMLEPVDPLDAPHNWVPLSSNTPFWYRNASTEGPAWMMEAKKYFDMAANTVDENQKREAMEHIRDIYTENIPVIVVGTAYWPWGSNNRLGNVPRKATVHNTFRGWSRPVFHEQLFIKNP